MSLLGGHNLYEVGRVKWKNESWTNFDPLFTFFADWSSNNHGSDITSPSNCGRWYSSGGAEMPQHYVTF